MFNRKKTSFHRIQILICTLIIMLFSLFCLNGCAADNDYPKTKDIDYTVVTRNEIPKELRKMIKERKDSAFELSFSCEGELYIVKGYGKQLSPEFSITVNELYLSDNYIVFDTELYGPKNETKSKTKSYPYIVVKTEYINKSIVFK